MTKDDTAALSPRQQAALPFLVAGPTVEEGCKRARISRNTFYEWLRDSPAFRQALTASREALIREALDQLKAAVGQAVQKLQALLEGENEMVQLRAAQTILDYGLKTLELEDLARRIEALEAAVKEMQGRERRWT